VPLTWWFMNNWLDKYTYRVTISIWLFGVVGAVVLLLTLVVVSLNTVRAAMSNPVKSLRTEWVKIYPDRSVGVKRLNGMKMVNFVD